MNIGLMEVTIHKNQIHTNTNMSSLIHISAEWKVMRLNYSPFFFEYTKMQVSNVMVVLASKYMHEQKIQCIISYQSIHVHEYQ